jgi:hypothetical protein
MALPGRDRSTRLAVGIACALFCLALAFLFAWKAVVDSDAWYHLAAGRWMVRHGAVPTHDTWSFTAPGGRWIPHSWLFQLAEYGAHLAGGVTGMVVFRALLAFGALFLLERAAALRGAPAAIRLPVIAIAAALAAYRFSDRPQMFSFVLAAGALWSLERWALTAFAGDARQPRIARGLWWLVPAFWVWGNSHAGVIYGLGILGAYAAEAVARRAQGRLAWNPWRFVAFAALCFVASLSGPVHVWTLLYPLVVLPKLRSAGFSVVEFMPEPAGTPGWQRYAVLALALAWLLLARRRPLRETLIVLGAAVLAFRWYRERAMFALVVAPFAVFALDDLMRQGAAVAGRGRARLAMVAVTVPLWIAATLLLAPRLGSARADVRSIERAMPVDLVDFYLSEKLPPRVLNMPIWGGYLVWRGEDRVKVFIDPRCEVYPAQVFKDLLGIQYDRPERGALMRQYGVECAVLDYMEAYPGAPADGVSRGFYKGLFEDPEWTLVYWDDKGMIYLRTDLWESRQGSLRAWRVVNPDSRSLAYLGKGERLTSGIEVLREHTAAQPGCRRSRELLATALCAGGRFAEAADEARALAARPDSRGSDYALRVNALDSLDRLSEARTAGADGVRKFPNDAQLLDVYGIVLARTGALREGYDALASAARVAAPSFEREHNMERMAREMGDDNAAARHARRAERLKPPTR